MMKQMRKYSYMSSPDYEAPQIQTIVFCGECILCASSAEGDVVTDPFEDGLGGGGPIKFF